jgi:hypothetical protein
LPVGSSAKITFGSVTSAYAQTGEEPGVVEEQLSERRLRLGVMPSVVQVMNGSGSGSVLGLGLGVSYGLSSQWALTGAFVQGFTTGGDFLFSEFEARVTYAITGALVSYNRQVQVDGNTLYSYEEQGRGGFRAQLLSGEYLFTTSLVVLPFLGFGGAVFYEFPSRSAWNYQLGLRGDIAIGDRQTLILPQLVGGVSFCF